MSTAKIQITWPKYIAAVAKIAQHFQKEGKKFDLIVGLTRGGLIPAVLLSHALDIPTMPFDPHVLHSTGAPREKINLPITPAIIRRILIVDDISDTGKTFNKTVNFFSDRGFNITTAAVYTNKTTTIFAPDFSVHDSHKKWVIFPYEDEKK